MARRGRLHPKGFREATLRVESPLKKLDLHPFAVLHCPAVSETHKKGVALMSARITQPSVRIDTSALALS